MMNSPSISKQGDLFISPCNFSEALFPLDKSPYEWKACNDAYTYSWSKDFNHDLKSLSTRDSVKMINSMGFCPQNRCQLYNLTVSDIDGQAPDGLCYTKIENGGLSYGACSFREGVFNSGVLIGYYNKTQPSPKPIYKKSRVVLGNKRGVLAGPDESIGSFINANQIYPGLIGTQCPLACRPSGFQNTVDDVKKMIVENNITLWIQLAPSGLENYFVDGVYTPGTGNCGVFPLEFFMDNNSTLSKGVSNFKITQHGSAQVPYVEMKYTITAYTSTLDNGRIKTTFDDMSIRRLSNRPVHAIKEEDPAFIRHLKGPIPPLGGPIGETMKIDRDVLKGKHTIREYSDENNETAEVEDTEDKEDISDINGINKSLSLCNTDALSLTLDENIFHEIPVIWKEVKVNVKHVWYHKWKDFRIPPPEDEQFIKTLAEEASSILSKGTASVAVNCLSGRGRTGTFSAIILGKLLSVRTHTGLIDVIVSMREHRDGLVETPAQFRFAASALSLPDTTKCDLTCVTKKGFNSLTPSIYIPFLTGILFTVVAVLVYLLATKNNLFSSLHIPIGERNRKYEQIRHFPPKPSMNMEDDNFDEVMRMKMKSLL